MAQRRVGVDRQTVNLSEFPNLVVIYLGMRVNAFTGLKTLAGFGPRIAGVAKAKPEGLLLHEDLVFSLVRARLGRDRILA